MSHNCIRLILHKYVSTSNVKDLCINNAINKHNEYNLYCYQFHLSIYCICIYCI